MFEPLVGRESLEERRVCIVIGAEVGVSKNLVVKRKGDFHLIVLSEA